MTARFLFLFAQGAISHGSNIWFSYQHNGHDPQWDLTKVGTQTWYRESLKYQLHQAPLCHQQRSRNPSPPVAECAQLHAEKAVKIDRINESW